MKKFSTTSPTSRCIAIGYLYRDASNYKVFNTVVFRNPNRLSVDSVLHTLDGLLLSDRTFVADQVRIPELFPYLIGNPTEDDHCLHELDSVHETDDEPTDMANRSIDEFIAEVESASSSGWQGFIPTVQSSRRQRFKLHL